MYVSVVFCVQDVKDVRRRSGGSNLDRGRLICHSHAVVWNLRWRSFDNVVEAMGPNYLFLFGQLCLGLLHELPTPPPLNVLSWPYEAVIFMLPLLERIRNNKSVLSLVERVRNNKFAVAGTSYSQFEDKAEPAAAEPATKAEDEPRIPAARPTKGDCVEVTSGEFSGRCGTITRGATAWRAKHDQCKGKVEPSYQVQLVGVETGWLKESALRKVDAAEMERRQAPERVQAKQELAKGITEYIDDHQADVAQEERWRTTFQRKIDQNFRGLEDKTNKIDENFRGLEEKTDKQLDNMQEKLDKILESLASAQAPRVQATLR